VGITRRWLWARRKNAAQHCPASTVMILVWVERGRHATIRGEKAVLEKGMAF